MNWDGEPEGMAALMIRPRELIFFEWVLVDNCNLNCAYCVNKGEYSQKPKSQMKYVPGLEIHIAKKILEMSGCADHVIVNLTGGDPLLSEHFIDVIKMLAACGNIRINLITNMKLLAHVAESICAIYPNMNIGGSIHAQYRSDEEIDQLAEMLNAYKGRLKISLSQVDSNLSREDRAKVERIAAKTGLTVAFQRFIPPWTEAGRVDDEQQIRDRNFVASLGKRCCLGYSHFLLLPDGSFCYDLWCIDRTEKAGDFLTLSPANAGDFVLDDMKKCPKTSCGCNYNVFHHQEYLAACRRLNHPGGEVFGPGNWRQSEDDDSALNRVKRWFHRGLARSSEENK